MKKSFDFRFVGLVILFMLCFVAFMALPINIQYKAQAELHTTLLIDEGIYYIRNQRSGLYMDVQDASFDIPTQMVQFGYNGNNNQQFKLNCIGTDLYEIIPLCNYFNCDSYGLDVANGSNANNAQIQTYTSNGSVAQQFKILQTGNNEGAFKILTATSSYSKCITVQNASMSTANLIQYSYGNDGTADNDHWYFERSVINSEILIPFILGYSNNIQFKIPDNKYYIVETFGNLNTTLTIENLSCGTIIDYDSGEDNNAMLGFQGEQGAIINIIINPNTNTFLTSCQLQIRRQQAVLYGFDYIDYNGNRLNTTTDLNTPYNELCNIYQTNKFINEEVTHIMAEDERGIPRLNSEIMFFSGHGSFFHVEFPNSILTESSIPELNCKLAYWSSCNSAQIDNISQNLVDKSIIMGALCSIGYTTSVDTYSSRIFSNKFFQKLADGYTITAAAQSAKNALFWPFNSARNYRIAGDGSITITTPNPVPKSASMLNKTLVNEFNDLIKHEKLYAYALENNLIRYFRTIDGYLTNECYDVVYDDKNNVCEISHRGLNIDNVEVLEKRRFDTAISDSIQKDDTVFYNLKEVKTHIIYYNFGKYITPVEINYCDYYSPKYQSFYQDVICINLATGEYIDYRDIVEG